jgi:hypothetical protein
MRFLRPYPIRSTHWSCSTFAELCRTYSTKGEFSKPYALELEQWEAWNDTFKSKYPKTYFLTEKLLDSIQDFIMYPSDVYHNIKYYCKNRFIHKTHIVSTGAKKGQFLDHEERMLNAIMNILVDFVENDSSIEHLTWETNLIHDEDWGVFPEDPHYGTMTEQALGAQTFLEVYNWWKVVRPTRKDPYEDYEKGSDWRITANIEQAYHEEDNLMIEKLLKYRHRLWT